MPGPQLQFAILLLGLPAKPPRLAFRLLSAAKALETTACACTWQSGPQFLSNMLLTGSGGRLALAPPAAPRRTGRAGRANRAVAASGGGQQQPPPPPPESFAASLGRRAQLERILQLELQHPHAPAAPFQVWEECRRFRCGVPASNPAPAAQRALIASSALPGKKVHMFQSTVAHPYPLSLSVQAASYLHPRYATPRPYLVTAASSRRQQAQQPGEMGAAERAAALAALERMFRAQAPPRPGQEL